MKTTKITTTKLTPSAGCYLTQKNLDDEKNRWFSDSIFLGKNDSADNYEEWTQAQKEEWEKEHAAEPVEEPENQ